MGSCCGKTEDDSQYGETGDRTQLINSHDDSCVATRIPCESRYHSYSEDSYKRSEEQSDINRIWQEMAANIIDVGTLESHGLEQHEFRERMSHYLGKLRSLSVSKSHWSWSKKLILVDIPTPDKAPFVNPSDYRHIIKAQIELDECVKQMKIEFPENNLVVPFHVTRTQGEGFG